MTEYRLHDQVGHLLRRANQRHKAIFNEHMPRRLPPTQFAALAMLAERGPVSQNLLGRLTAMDSATIAGVVGRLADRGWVVTTPDSEDQRMVVVELTDEGRGLVDGLVGPALTISAETLAPIDPDDHSEVLRLLHLLAGDET